MLTKDEALELVAAKLRTMSPRDDSYIVVDADTIERPFGWVFFYNSKKFLETGAFSHRLAGNGPVIVNKHDGTIEMFGASKPPMTIIAEYERRAGG